MCIVCECVYVLKLLLLGGDIEQNPGPPKKDSSQSNDDVVTLLKSLNEKIDKNHSEILSQLNEVRQTQTKLERQMASMNDRLVAVEEKVAASQASSAFDITQEVSEAVQNEAEAFHKRLDDLEDRSRRDNLLFHGLPDTQNETWDESEKLVREKLLSEMDLELPSEAIARAHRLGKFSNDKCRPVIVKFTNFKIREAVFTDRSKMKNAGIKVTEDFCLSTRNARKKLFDFGQASGEKYAIRQNKLFIKNKCYIYISASDSICEYHINNQASPRSPDSSALPADLSTA